MENSNSEPQSSKKKSKTKKKMVETEEENFEVDEPQSSTKKKTKNKNKMEKTEEEQEQEEVEVEESQSSKKKKSKGKRKMETKEEEEEKPDEQIEVTIEVVNPDPEKSLPYIAYFPSGFDPAKHPGSTDVKVYRNKHMAKRTELVVSPDGVPVDFVGTSYSGEAAALNRSMYMLGVLDKDTGILKIVPIGSNKVFRMEPRVCGVDYKEPVATTNVEEEEMSAQELAEQMREKRRKTDAALGTKKQRAMLNKWDERRKDDEPEARLNLAEKMKNVEVKELALANTEAHVALNIPPYNSSATTPQEAYILDEMILSVEWNHLQDIYYALLKEEDVSHYPNFIRYRIDKLKKIKDDSEQLKIACVLSFINHLLKFKDQHSMDGVSSSKHHKVPNIINHRFTTMFAVTESRRMPPEKMNLLISYVLVLTLFCDKFHTDCTDISKDLRMSTLSVRQIYQHLGCKFVRENGSFYATLPVPLKFPEVRARKKPRRN